MIHPVRQHVRIKILRASFLLVFPFIILAYPGWNLDTPAHEFIETAGIALLLVGVLGRFWSILYVGGRKNSELVQDGPYSVTRNPLYLFSTIAAIGIGLMLGAATFAFVLGGLAFVILYLTAKRESRFLEQEFGDAYRSYAATVPFFLPRLNGYRSGERVEFSPRALRANAMDASVFLASIPLVELLDMIKMHFDSQLLIVF